MNGEVTGQLIRQRPGLRAAGRAEARFAGVARGGRPGSPGEPPEPGQLGLQLAGFLLQGQDPADAGQVQPVGGQRADLGQLLDVPAGVPAAGSSSPSRS